MNAFQKHILIVDDEVEVVELLAEFFEEISYKVSRADNASAGMALLNAHPDIGVVITDIGMPVISGIDFLKIIRETNEDVPVVMITGMKTLDYAISAIKYGAQDYIVKPFQLEEVHKIVDKILRYRFKSERKARIFEYADALEVQFSLPTREADPGVIAHFLSKFLLNSGFCPRDQLNPYHVAFMETLINAIEHGNLELPSVIKGSDFEKMMMFEELRDRRLQDPKYGQRLLRVHLQYDRTRFSLTVIDEGPGFDWKGYFEKQNDYDPVSTKSYGRGFMLIRHVIDEVHFNDKGNVITLIKSREGTQNKDAKVLGPDHPLRLDKIMGS